MIRAFEGSTADHVWQQLARAFRGIGRSLCSGQ